MYYTTPIYSFRCKCHLCGNWFEIRTDPQNTRYVVESGARQKNEEWDEADNGGIVLNRKDDGQPADAFAQVEKKTSDQLNALATKDRLEELMEFSDARNSDPYALSQRLRKTFRQEKAELISKSRGDDQLRSKYSLPAGLKFVEAEDDDTEQFKEARRLIAHHKHEEEAKRCRLNAQVGLTPTRSKRCLPPKTSQLANLKEQLVGNRRRRTDPFLSGSLASRAPKSRARPLVSLAAGTSKSQTDTKPSCPVKSLSSLAGYSSD